MGIPSHTPPPTTPDTLGRWPQRIRPFLYLVLILFVLFLLTSIIGQLAWSMIIIFLMLFIVCLGIVWT
ncbi:MAG: hypothetical protein ACFFD8_06150, partial [Candidatus Thorarchaeota archaeon]